LALIEALAYGDPVPDTSAICQDRNELLALLAEISKGERSEFLPHITQIAHRVGTSPQEIASRAGFLLACLDTPGDDDYYAILGVPSTATPHEIRDAWVARLSLYHPDRHPANGDWFTRQAARLNEAYHTLKDPARRQAYDERRRRELFARQRGDSSALRPATRESPMPSLFSGQMRRRLPTIITGGSVIAAGLMLVFLFASRPAHRPEATVFSPANIQGPTVDGLAGGVPSAPLDQRDVRSLRPQLERKPVKQWPSREGPALLVPHDIQTASEPSGPPAILAQALPPVVPEPKGLDRQEIDALLDEYVDAYEKGDVERVMTTLSPKVREKGTLDYQAIRSLYAKGFTGREQIIYRLKSVEVQIKGDLATVTAQYLISARNANQSQKGDAKRSCVIRYQQIFPLTIGQSLCG